nr:GcrA family cell cycle regulator [Shinella sp.]
MTATPAMHAAPLPRRLADLERYACRWPVNDASLSELHLFCGERTAATKPYCRRHCRLAYRAPPASAFVKKDK